LFSNHLSNYQAYLTADLLSVEKSPQLKLCVTAGVGSDHVDLDAANLRKITVAEVSGSNVVSVAEHVIMSILLLVRNFTRESPCSLLPLL
jgi:formate dehydrogenase